MLIGAHISVSGGVDKSVERAVETGCRAMQIFTKNANRWAAPPLRVLHMNDSLKPRGSRIDRHAHIGEGTLGLDPFRRIMTHRRLTGVPKILETPKGDDPLENDRRNLEILRSLTAGRALKPAAVRRPVDAIKGGFNA